MVNLHYKIHTYIINTYVVTYLHLKDILYIDIIKYILNYVTVLIKLSPLSIINAHPRDKQIKFEEEGHLYYIYNEDYILLDAPRLSVTTLIHNYFNHFDADSCITKMMKSRNWINSKYHGMTADEIKFKWDKEGKESSSLGTKMHYNIEQFLNGINVKDDSIEFKFFLKFWDDFNAKYPQFIINRTEALVFYENFGKDHVTLCGSIDCMLHDEDDNIIILDWKRSKEIKTENRYQHGYYPFNTMPDTNFSHYTLQLNIYRHILESKYNKNVIFMMLVILHPNQVNYKCIP